MRVLSRWLYGQSEPHRRETSRRAGDRVIARAGSRLTACAEWARADVIRPGVDSGREVRNGRSLRSANRGPRAADSTSRVATRREPGPASVIASTRRTTRRGMERRLEYLRARAV